MYQTIQNAIGDDVLLPFDDNGTARCPICAEGLGGCLAYYKCGTPSEEICPGCKIHFGDDDVPSTNKVNTKEYFSDIRLNLLIQNHWDSGLLDRFRAILMIDIDELLKHKNLDEV